MVVTVPVFVCSLFLYASVPWVIMRSDREALEVPGLYPRGRRRELDVGEMARRFDSPDDTGGIAGVADKSDGALADLQPFEPCVVRHRPAQRLENDHGGRLRQLLGGE